MNFSDVVSTEMGDVIDGGLGDVGASVSLGTNGASVSGNVSLAWLALAGLLGWLYYKR